MSLYSFDKHFCKFEFVSNYITLKNFTLNFHTSTITNKKIFTTQITADCDMAMNGDQNASGRGSAANSGEDE
jgi:hypothetical protein